MKRILPVIIIILISSVTFAQMHKDHGKTDKKFDKKEEMHGCPMKKGDMERMGCHGSCMGTMIGNDTMLKQIGVSEKDRAAIRETLHKMRKDIMDIHFQINETKISLHEEYAKQTINEKRIDELNDTIATLHKSKIVLMLNTEKDILKRLTSEQRSKLMQPMRDKMKRGGWDKEKGMSE